MKKYNSITKKFDTDYLNQHPYQIIIDKLNNAEIPFHVIGNDVVVEDKDVASADLEAGKV